MKPGTKTYLIDGYNLLHRAYPDWLHDQSLVRGVLTRAREVLEARLKAFQADRKPTCRILLVFDGEGARGARRDAGRNFQVLFSRAPETADDLILLLCRQLEGREDVEVITSDLNDIASRLHGLRCRHTTSEEFARLLANRAAKTGGGHRAGEKPSAVTDEELDGWLRDFDMHPDQDEL